MFLHLLSVLAAALSERTCLSLCPFALSDVITTLEPAAQPGVREVGKGGLSPLHPPPRPPRPSLPSMKVLQKTDYLKHEAGSDLMGTVVIKRQG